MSRGTNWTEEQAAAAQADYERKMKRVRDRNTHKTGSEFAVESDPVPNSREVKTGGDDTTKNSTRRTERPRESRSISNEGKGMGKSMIVAPAKPQKPEAHILHIIKTFYAMNVYLGAAQLPEKVIKSNNRESEPNFTENRFYNDILIGKYNCVPQNIFFAPCTFILPSGNKYSPDFCMISDDWSKIQLPSSICLFEVKWKKVLNRDSQIRFAWARHEFGMFGWRAWQWKNNIWKKIWK